jgi:hypothetical protein
MEILTERERISRLTNVRMAIARDGLPVRVGDWWETVPVEEGKGVYRHKLRIRKLTTKDEWGHRHPFSVRKENAQLIVDSISGGLNQVRPEGWKIAWAFFVCDRIPEQRLKDIVRVDEKLYPMLNLMLNDLFAERDMSLRVRGRRNIYDKQTRDFYA